ncbi:MAG: CDP-glucose 4,6-dehydratase [Hyphomicrobiaceae bacterium]
MSLSVLPSLSFWRGRRVLLTGHTGFKGAWTAVWLAHMGAEVTGFALAPDSDPALFEMAGLGGRVRSLIGDLRDMSAVRAAVVAAKPEIVLHLAAQPIVRRSIVDPVETIAVNVLGTAHLLEAVRVEGSARLVLVVTSDKVYANSDSGRPFAESDALGGKDPYSASKAATELVARAFAQSYFEDLGVRLATARGGNVVGGGDYAADRIVPDIVRSALAGETLVLRMPEATRPWQHVLDCIAGYLVYVEAMAQDEALPRSMNFGPVPGRDVTVRQLAEATLAALGRPVAWQHEPVAGAKEMKLLAVDSIRARSALGWRDRLAGDALVAWTARWYRAVHAGADAFDTTLRQINDYYQYEPST